MPESHKYRIVIREKSDQFNERMAKDLVTLWDFESLEVAKSLAASIAPHVDSGQEVVVQEPIVKTYVSYKEVDWQ